MQTCRNAKVREDFKKDLCEPSQLTALCNRACHASQTGNRHRFLTISAEGRRGITAEHLRVVTKTLRVMQWTAVFILGCCLHLSAAVKSQSVTFEGKNVPLNQVMDIVEKQTGFTFLFNAEKINLTTPISIATKEMPLKEFLSAIFKDQRISFEVREKTIVLVTKKPTIIIEETPPITIREEL